MNQISKSEIFVALYSHFDQNKYSIDEVIKEIQQCNKEGASIFHFHIAKLKHGVEDYIEIINRLEKLSFEISLSDYNEIVKCKEKINNTKRIMISMHAASCKVFDKEFHYDFVDIIEKVKEYLKYGFVPEMCVFNEKGIENCIKLNEIFNKKFVVGVYLDYPYGLKASKENINEICTKLKDCYKLNFAIYNNQSDLLINEIIENGANVRVGTEDNEYNRENVAISNLDAVNRVAKIKYEKIKKILTNK